MITPQVLHHLYYLMSLPPLKVYLNPILSLGQSSQHELWLLHIIIPVTGCAYTYRSEAHLQHFTTPTLSVIPTAI